MTFSVPQFLIFQTKDKMCDISDTTHLYPFTTPIVAKTTSRNKEATAGRDAPSTSHPPTSVPTEGKVENNELERSHGAHCAWARSRSFKSWWILCSGTMLNEVHLLELFFIGIDVFSLFTTCARHFCLLGKAWIYSRWQTVEHGAAAVFVPTFKQCRLN